MFVGVICYVVYCWFVVWVDWVEVEFCVGCCCGDVVDDVKVL